MELLILRSICCFAQYHGRLKGIVGALSISAHQERTARNITATHTVSIKHAHAHAQPIYTYLSKPLKPFHEVLTHPRNL